jgi:glycerol kinase
MDADSGIEMRRLKVDGGMTANHLLMQFVADVLDLTVERPMVAETVSLGAAYTAGLTVGYWPDLGGLRSNWHRAALWEPQMEAAVRDRERRNWDRAVERTYGWVQHEA